MKKNEKAIQYFDQGYTCAQAVLLALIDYTNLEKEKALNIASGFGAGVGDAKTVCGVVSGAVMAIGLAEGSKHQVLLHKNANIRLKCDAFIASFEHAQGVISCPAIIKQAKSAGQRPHQACSYAVARAVEIAIDLLET